MDARAAFKKAQQEYKKTMKDLEESKTQWQKEHEKLMKSVLEETKAKFVTPSLLQKTMRPSKEALRDSQIKHREASHKLYERLSKDFRKSHKELQESKSQDESKEQFLERLSDLNPEDLTDFTEEEAKDWESKHGMNKDSQDLESK